MDFVITRELPTVGVNRVQANKDGQILIQVKNGVILFNPNENCIGKPKKLSDLVTLARLRVPAQKLENIFSNVAHKGLPKFAEGKNASGLTDLISFKNISISDSGVSKNLKCLYLCVTDSYNGIIFNYENGSLNPICNINEEIAIIESINTELLLNEEDMNKLRINYLCWIKGISFKYLKDPIWPLVTSSLFLCFTETSRNWVYQFNCFTNKITRKFLIDFKLETENDEYILYCEQGEWRESKSKDVLSIQIIVATSRNRVIIKKCLYDISTDQWNVEENNLFFSFDDYIVNLKVHSIDNKDILSVLLPNSMEIYSLEEETNVEILLNNVITMDNLIQFNDFKLEGLIHIILSNTFGYLIHIKLNIKDFSIIGNEHYNYQEKIESEELPIFNKLNKINENNTSNSIIIDSLNIDTTGELIYMTTLPSHMKSNFKFFNEKKDDITFSIFKSTQDSKINFNNKDYFNSVYSTPILWKSIENLMFGVEGDIKKNYTNMIEGINYEGSILNNLFLNFELDSERINSVLGNEEDLLKFKRKMQRFIANEILKLIESHKIATNSEEDLFIYFQYSKLLNKNIPEKSICKLRVQGKNNNIYERFDASMIDIDKCIKEGGIVQSLEGHYWKLCDVTLLPILSPIVKHCGNCNSVKVSGGSGEVLSKVMEATPLCPFCGGRYVE
ncbi:hypothetical protein C6P42_000820 [Pichia californica]|nr:hypothetical protein C6P42_000820 [[Candida] californica]